MPKLDLPEGFGVQPADLDTPPVQVNPGVMGNPGDGLKALGQGVSEGVSALSRQYALEHQKEVATQTTNSETVLQDFTNQKMSPDGGLLSLRGDAAHFAAPDIYESIQKRRDEIAQGIPSNEARRLFMMRSNGILEETYKQGDAWVGHQRLAAQESATQGLQATSLQALANSYADPDARARYTAQPEGPITALALSPEDRAAKLSEWRQKAASTVLNQYIAAKDFQGAQAYFAQEKDTLGPASAQYESTINTLRQKVEGRQTALQILNDSRKPNGFIDDAKAVSAFEALPEDKNNEHTEQAFHQLLGLEKTAEGNQKSGHFNDALSAYLQRHSLADVPATTEAWLRANDPEGWQRLEQVSYTASSREKDPQSTAAFISLAQDIEQNPLKYKGMKPDQFNSIAIKAGANLSDWKELGKKYANAQKVADYSLPVASTVNELFERSFDLPKSKPDTWPADKQDLWRDVHDYVDRQANTYIRDHNGKRPDDEELKKFAVDRLLTGTVAGGGRIFGDANHVTRVEAEHNPRYSGKTFTPDVPDAAGSQAPSVPAAPAAQAPAQAPSLPPGVKKGTDGKLYQRNAAGKWAAFNG